MWNQDIFTLRIAVPAYVALQVFGTLSYRSNHDHRHIAAVHLILITTKSRWCHVLVVHCLTEKMYTGLVINLLIEHLRTWRPLYIEAETNTWRILLLNPASRIVFVGEVPDIPYLRPWTSSDIRPLRADIRVDSFFRESRFGKRFYKFPWIGGQPLSLILRVIRLRRGREIDRELREQSWRPILTAEPFWFNLETIVQAPLVRFIVNHTLFRKSRDV